MASTGVQEDREQWVRSREPQSFWRWRGWLPLLGIALAFLLGVYIVVPFQIEGQVAHAAKFRLAGMGWEVKELRVEARDLDLWIHKAKNAPPQWEAQVKAVAKTTRCASWAGPVPCVEEVKVHPLAESEPAAHPQAPAPAPAPAPRAHDFRIEWDPQSLKMVGELPSRERQMAAMQALQSVLAEQKLVLETKVTGHKGKDSDRRAFERAVVIVPRFESGVLHWREGRMDLQGKPKAKQAAVIEALFHQTLEGGQLGELSLEADETAPCNAEFRRLLEGKGIRFRTASDRIDSRSAALLGKLAKLIRRCPGQIFIEGHTDDRASESVNLRLSQSRAEAVRAALVELGARKERLQAIGKGSLNPLASNRSWKGRAQNRRIEIRVGQAQESTQP